MREVPLLDYHWLGCTIFVVNSARDAHDACLP
jgi:hypothetical protein